MKPSRPYVKLLKDLIPAWAGFVSSVGVQDLLLKRTGSLVDICSLENVKFSKLPPQLETVPFFAAELCENPLPLPLPTLTPLPWQYSKKVLEAGGETLVPTSSV